MPHTTPSTTRPQDHHFEVPREVRELRGDEAVRARSSFARRWDAVRADFVAGGRGPARMARASRA